METQAQRAACSTTTTSGRLACMGICLSQPRYTLHVALMRGSDYIYVGIHLCVYGMMGSMMLGHACM